MYCYLTKTYILFFTATYANSPYQQKCFKFFNWTSPLILRINICIPFVVLLRASFIFGDVRVFQLPSLCLWIILQTHISSRVVTFSGETVDCLCGSRCQSFSPRLYFCSREKFLRSLDCFFGNINHTWFSRRYHSFSVTSIVQTISLIISMFLFPTNMGNILLV